MKFFLAGTLFLIFDVIFFCAVPKEWERVNRWMLIPGGGYVGYIIYHDQCIEYP